MGTLKKDCDSLFQELPSEIKMFSMALWLPKKTPSKEKKDKRAIGKMIFTICVSCDAETTHFSTTYQNILQTT